MELSLGQILQAMAEISGKQLSDAAAAMFLADLRGYPEASVKAALSRCRKELRTFPTIADILARIDDGRPGVEEAWTMLPGDESQSCVWTEEMSEAFGAVRAQLERDPIAARMAFKEIYPRLVTEARASRKPARWIVSLGHDRSGRELALRDAVTRGRLTEAQAVALLPEYVPQSQRSDAPALGLDVRRLLREMP